MKTIWMKPRARSVVAWLAVVGMVHGQDTLGIEDEDMGSSLGGRITQGVSWYDGSDPAWAHTTSASLTWIPAPNDAGLDELRAGLDLLGQDFQFDSLWGVEPGVGMSLSRGIVSLDVDGWLSSDGLDSIYDMGAAADLSANIGGEGADALFIAVFGTLTDVSGSEAGTALRWSRPIRKASLTASLSATRKWDADISSLTQNLPKRFSMSDSRGDQWVFSVRSGIKLPMGEFALAPRLTLSATRSELEVSSTKAGGRKRMSTSMSTKTSAVWAMDGTPSLRLTWTRGIFDCGATVGSTSSVALSKYSDSDWLQPWASASFGIGW